MEQHICKVCGNIYDTGAILLDQYMRNRFEAHTLTGTGRCTECQSKIDEGFTIFIVVKDGEQGNDPYRTGEILYFKACEPERQPTVPVAYMHESTARQLKEGLHEGKD